MSRAHAGCISGPNLLEMVKKYFVFITVAIDQWRGGLQVTYAVISSKFPLKILPTNFKLPAKIIDLINKTYCLENRSHPQDLALFESFLHDAIHNLSKEI